MQARTKEKQELCTCRGQQTLMSMALSTPFDLLWSMLKLMSTFTSVSASVSFTIGTCIKISNGFYPSLPFSFYQSPCSNLHEHAISNVFFSNFTHLFLSVFTNLFLLIDMNITASNKTAVATKWLATVIMNKSACYLVQVYDWATSEAFT